MTSSFHARNRRILSHPRISLYREILGRAIYALTAVLIFFNPFPELTAVEEISFYGAFILFLALVALKGEVRMANPLALPLGLFFAWTCIGLPFALDAGNSAHDVYAHLFKYLVIFYLLVNVFATEKRLSRLILIVIASTTVYAVVTMCHFYLILGNPLTVKLGYRLPWEIPTNVIGVLTIAALIFCLFRLLERKTALERIILAAVLFALTAATLATQTRSAIGAMIIGLIVAAPRLKKVLLLFLPLILLMAFVMPVKNRLAPGSLLNKIRTDDRINTWYIFYEMAKDHPLTGIGFGFETYQDDDLLERYNARVPDSYRRPVADKAPHNFIVDTAARTGFVGLALFLIILLRMLWTAGRLACRGRSSFVGNWSLAMLAASSAWIVQGMFENVLSGPPAIILIMIMAMTMILWNIERAEAAAPAPPGQTA
ncbi:MAG: O-antigen ligase family protein [Pseudomonadota bacterium]|nr:O-antigen ligase family protein [Pseudomonadota bacterium]